jgi:hypothetical protein
MSAARLLYGLGGLPKTLAADDSRLPAVTLGSEPLRLNSVPLPADAPDASAASHTSRMSAMRSFLLASCGDYNASLRRAVDHYLDAISAHVAQNRNTLADRLAPFHGLYREEDWCWSALRPFPRAWWRHRGAWEHADLAFWDGQAVTAMGPRDFESGLPIPFRHFWNSQALPVSPFRRPFPAWADEGPIRSSSR